MGLSMFSSCHNLTEGGVTAAAYKDPHVGKRYLADYLGIS